MLAQYGDNPFGPLVYFGGIMLGLLGVLTVFQKEKGFSFWCGLISVAWSGLVPALFGPIPTLRAEWFLWFSPIYYSLTVVPALIAIYFSVTVRRSLTDSNE